MTRSVDFRADVAWLASVVADDSAPLRRRIDAASDLVNRAALFRFDLTHRGERERGRTTGSRIVAESNQTPNRPGNEPGTEADPTTASDTTSRGDIDPFARNR